MEELEYIVASDISNRDGIGLEVWLNNELIIEIFRDDTDKTRIITTYRNEFPVQIIEESIQVFKDRGLWEFEDSNN